MKCRPKPSNTKKINTNVPKRGSAGFWFRIILAGFYLPMMLIGVPLSIIFCSWNINLFWVGPVIGLTCAFFITRKYYHSLMTMNDEQYADQFKVVTVPTQQEYGMKDTGCPMDPASSAYWTLGPGSSAYRERNRH